MRTTTSWGEDPRSDTHASGQQRAGTHLRRAAAALLAVVALAFAAAAPVTAAPEVDDGPTAAAWGADWLDDQLDGGIPLETFGSPDWGTTLEAGLALAAVEGHDARLDQLWAAVQAEREGIVAASGSDVPGRLAQVVLLAVALGEDPTAVGDAPGEDLVARLAATRTTSGPDEGLHGSQSPTYDGAYRQGYAIAALVAAGEEPDPTAIGWLEAQQCDDGSWMPYRADTSEPCAFDAAAFLGPDSNSTAAAISGLLAADEGAAAVEEGLDWLDGSQNDDGGWGFFPGDGSDPNSTAVVVMALRSAEALGAPEFTDRDGTPLESLLSFQLGCDAGAGAGAFTFPGTNGMTNTFATVQAVSAAAGATLGITGPLAPAATVPCEATTTTTTTPTTSTTAAPTTAPPTSAPGTTDQPAEVRDVSAESGDAEVRNTGDTSSSSGDRAAAGSLARTGGSTGLPVVVGGLLLVLGAATLLGARLRRP